MPTYDINVETERIVPKGPQELYQQRFHFKSLNTVLFLSKYVLKTKNVMSYGIQ